MILQTGSTDVGAYVGYLALLAVTLVALVLGLFIAFQAYRGYRRNQSQRMLFLALGFVLLTVAPFALSLVVTFAGQRLGVDPGGYTYWLPVTTRLVEIVGLCCILYSLTIDR